VPHGTGHGTRHGGRSPRAPLDRAVESPVAVRGEAAREAPTSVKSDDPSPEELLRHRDWLEGLATRLVSDASVADDLVQDTYLAVLTRPLRGVRSTESWLAAILRRQAARRQREERRRRRREAAAATRTARAQADGGEPGSAILRRLVAELDALREPYRTTLLLRFVEGREPREIAAASGEPVRTVHTRIVRGLRLLRERMDRGAGGDRARWSSGLLALVGAERERALPGGPPDAAAAPRSARAPRTGSPAPRAAGAAPWVAAGGAAACLLVVLAVRGHGGDAGEADPLARATDAAAAHDTGPAAGARTPVAPIAPSGARRARRASPGATGAAASDVAPAGAGRRRVRGRVVDPAGAPLAGVAVRFERGGIAWQADVGAYDFDPVDARGAREPGAVTRGDGLFELAIPRRTAGRLVAGDAAHAPVFARAVMFPWIEEPVVELVAAPRCELAGEVLDAGGAPLAAVVVRFRAPPELAEEVDPSTSTWRALEPWARTDAAGRFELSGAYRVQGASLEVSRGGERLAAFELDPAEDGALELVVERAPSPDARQRGRVVTASGAPCPGALVVAGEAWVEADADGAFELARSALDGVERVRAFVRDRRPASRAVAGLATRDELVLTVADAAAPALEGRVVDVSGAPVAGAWVYATDPTFLSFALGSRFAEDLVAGERESHPPRFVPTDAAGRFRLPGLLPRAYRLRALRLPTLESVRGEPVEAGARNVELRLPGPRSLAPASGWLRGTDGRPLAGVRVCARIWALTLELPDGSFLQSGLDGPVVVTDAEGRFAFDALPVDPAEGCHLSLEGGGVYPGTFDLPPRAREDMGLVCPRAARLRVFLASAPPERATFELRLPNGTSTAFFGADDVVLSQPRTRLHAGTFDADGISDAYLVPDTASELVLSVDGAPVMHVPLELVPGEENALSL